MTGVKSAILNKNVVDWIELIFCQRLMPLHCGKMADEFVVAAEKYGSGSLERKYRFSTESGNIERIGKKRETFSASLKQFFKVIQLQDVDARLVVLLLTRWVFEARLSENYLISLVRAIQPIYIRFLLCCCYSTFIALRSQPSVSLSFFNTGDESS